MAIRSGETSSNFVGGDPLLAPRFYLIDLRSGADDKTAAGGAKRDALHFDRMALNPLEKTQGSREQRCWVRPCRFEVRRTKCRD
jgi:hypothetical protein